MSKKTFLAFFMLLSLCVQAQREHYISLENQKLIAPKFKYYVEEVIDGRKDKTSIGIVQKGLFNSKASAYFENGLEKEFLSLFQRSFTKKDGMLPISVRVNYFQIYEITTVNREYCGVRINISFFEKVGNQYIERYNSGDNIEGTGIDVTKLHDDNTARAVGHCCRVFAERTAENKLWERFFDLNIPADSLYNDYEILKTVKPAKGYYENFEDFRDNLPKNNVGFDLKQTSEDSKNFWVGKVKWKDGVSMDNDMIWGVSDGEYCYMRTGKRYIRLEQDSAKQFYVLGNVGKESTGIATVIGGLIGGLVGGLIVGAIEGAINEDRTVLEPFYINFYDATFTHRKIPKKQESRLVLSFRKDNDAPTDAPIYLDGKIVGTFVPGEALKVHIPPPVGQMKICVGDANSDACKTREFELFKTQYLEVSYRKGKFNIQPLTNEYVDWLKSDIEKGKVKVVEKNL